MKRYVVYSAVALLLITVFARCVRSTKRNNFSSVIGAFAISSPVARHQSTDFPYLPTAIATLNTQLNGSTPTDCIGPAFTTPSVVADPSCYGPSLNYQNHPDGADGANCSGSSYPCLSYGALGLWADSDSSGEACSVTKLNVTLQTVAGVINTSHAAVAALLCLANLNGSTVPSIEGTPLDVAGTFNVLVPGGAFETASIEQLTARTGAQATYRVILDGVVNGALFKATLIHSPTNSANSQFAGHLNGILGIGVATVAYSVTYKQSSSALTSLMKAGVMTNTSANPFDSSDDIDYSASTFSGSSLYYALSSLSPSTGLGTSLMSWQLSSLEDRSRVFNATTRSSSGSEIGYTYFGFGQPFTSGTDLGLIERMVCNWSGPGFSHTGLTGKAQAQSITRDSSGVFVVGSESHLSYAPENSCDNGANTFAVGASALSVPAAVGVTTNDLAAYSNYYGDLGSIPTITLPTY